jgi:hypothetical protein
MSGSVARALARIENGSTKRSQSNEPASLPSIRTKVPGVARSTVNPARPSVDFEDAQGLDNGSRVVAAQHRRANEILNANGSEIPSPFQNSSLSSVITNHGSNGFDFTRPHPPPSGFRRNFHEEISRLRYFDEEVAARRLQAIWRGVSIRWFVCDLYLLRIAVVLVQRHWRKFLWRSTQFPPSMTVETHHSSQAFVVDQPPPGASLDIPTWSSWVTLMNSHKHVGCFGAGADV